MPVSLDEIGGGGKYWAPKTIGDKIVGQIRTVKRQQQTDMDGKPLTWEDGNPRMLTYIELETDLHDDDDDDGVRALYAKGGKNFEAAQGTGTSMEVAIAEAVRTAGERSIDEGATLAVQYTGISKPTTRGFQGANLFKAQYKRPTASVSTDDLFGES